MSQGKNRDEDVPAHVVEARKGTRGRLARTLVAQTLGLGGKLLQQVLLVPLFIAAWGVAAYQDWLILFAAATLFSMFDFGLQIYFGNRLTVAWLEGGPAALDRTIAIAMGLYAAILPPVFAAVLVAAYGTDELEAVGIRVLPVGDAASVFVLLVAGTLAALPLGVVGSVYRARGRFDRGVNFFNLLLVVQTLVMAVALLTRQSPIFVAAAMAATVLGAWLVLWIDLRQNYSEFRLALAWPTLAEIRGAAGNSGSFTAIQAMQAITLSGTVMLLGYLDPATGAVVAFSVERTLAGVLRLTIQQVSLAFGAEMSRQFVHGDSEPLRFLYRNTGRLGAAAGGILGGLVLALAEPVIRVWTHGAVTYDPALLMALIAAVLLGAPAQPALVLFVLTNRPRSVAWAAFTQASIILVLSVPLIPMIGPLGIGLAWAIAEFLTHGVYLSRVASATIGLQFGRYLARTLGVALVSLAVSYGVAWPIVRALAPGDLAAIGVATIGWGAVMLPIALAALVTPEQRRWLLEKLRDRVPAIRSRK